MVAANTSLLYVLMFQIIANWDMNYPQRSPYHVACPLNCGKELL